MSQQINLFNPILLKQKKYFSTVTILQALTLLALGCVVLAGYARYTVSNLETQAAASRAQAEAARTQLVQVLAEYGPRQASASLASDIVGQQRTLKDLQRVETILQREEFGNTDGYAEYLRAFARQHERGVWLTGLEITGAGSKVAVHGRALRPEQVPSYMQRLKREPVLQGKAFDTLEIHAPRDTTAAFVEFSLQ